MAGWPLRYYDFWTQRIKTYKIGMFLGQPEVSAKIFENFQNGFTQKLLDGPIRYYDF